MKKIERLQKKANILLSFFGLIRQLAGSPSLSLLSYCAGMIRSMCVEQAHVSQSREAGHMAEGSSFVPGCSR